MLLIHKQYDELLHKCSDQEREIKELQAEVEALKSKVVCERQLKIDAQAEVERLQNQLDHISFESYTLTISQANKRLHSKVEDLQAEVERLRKVFMHCIENGVMTQDAYEIYDELKAKADNHTEIDYLWRNTLIFGESHR